MKQLITLLFLSITFQVLAQNCNCEQEYNFVVNYYEENLPGFKDNVNEDNKAQYNEFKKNLLTQAKSYCDNRDLCYKTLLVYVEFFKDNHSSIYNNSSISVDENSAEDVKKFLESDTFKNREMIVDFQPKTNTSLNTIENIYQTDDASYTVAVIKNQNSFRDYVGVILESKTALWKKGQVKFELKKTGNNRFDLFMYYRNHSLRYFKNVVLKDGILGDGWYNTQLQERKSYNLSESRELVFKEIDSETNYMNIPTFSGDWYAKISEFYQNNDTLIRSKPNLIIDVRDNGGGSDACVSPLLKYIYTQPFVGDKVEVYATKENIRKSSEWYEYMKKDTVNYDKEFLTYFAEEIARMKAAPNKSFIMRSEPDTIRLDEVLKYPKNVAVITNKNCASSCETLLFLAKESKKTIIVGENSGGYVGYGEIGSVPTPHFKFELGSTMTRYDKQRAYEVDGVPPTYYLNNQENWINQTLRLLKERE